ncbi:uncharacterized protein K441DRAFT_700754 [Cenococcum geophilum 1.58]|uniref:Uncharacterized protein n=1 Tax=Cenococcum geophilum 1.58 TaxID=794803 RepID=A0ACC8ENX3_9PEZI|nr:hypothetical protein K441DRAFT_700754 [Cenococcum geophilum 1.58]
MNFPCQQCIGKTFNSSEALKNHMSSLHYLECQTCGKKFSDKPARKQHINDVHSKPDLNKGDKSKRCKRPSGDRQVVKQHLGGPVHAPIYISNTYNNLVHSVQSIPQHTAGAHTRTGQPSSKVVPNTTMPKRSKKSEEIKAGPRRRLSPENERKKDKLQGQDERIPRGRRRSL